MFGRKREVDLLNTAEMDDFFDRLDRINESGLLGMRAAWKAIDRAEHEDAWTAVRAAGARDGLNGEIDRVRKKAIDWASRGSDIAPEVRIGQVQNWQLIKMDAGEAIVDAALAVALGSRLDERHRATLIGPWLGAVEGAQPPATE
jgi:hypothetical protein